MELIRYERSPRAKGEKQGGERGPGRLAMRAPAGAIARLFAFACSKYEPGEQRVTAKEGTARRGGCPYAEPKSSSAAPANSRRRCACFSAIRRIDSGEACAGAKITVSMSRGCGVPMV